MKHAPWAVIAVLTLLASAARADIYEWSDASGARHFTNDKRGVPEEYQDTARLFVSDWSHPTSDGPAAAPAAADQPAPTQAQVATDLSAIEQAFTAGLRTAMEMSGGGGGGGGGVQVNGPLAVASSRPSDSYVGYPGFYPPWPWYYPFVTTGFDGGRSRHQTLRMLLQDQFAIDRDGPFAYQRWDQPGIGPALAPFLPRGLPYGVDQFGRVIFR